MRLAKIKHNFITEFFTATFDNGKISGCRINSFAYFHEYRHLIQHKNKVICFISSWITYFTFCLGIFTIYCYLLVPERSTLIIGGYAILPLTIYFSLLEIDANVIGLYYFIKFKVNKLDEKRKKNDKQK